MASQVSAAHVAFGRAVRAERHAKGWSQEDLAAEAGLHRNYVGAIERGEKNVALTNILRISRVLDVSAAALVAEAEKHA